MSETTADSCGCDDFTATRRTFLRGAATAVGLGVSTRLVGDVFTQTSYGATAQNPNVLVVLSMRGGADGLSLIVPHGERAYEDLRPRTAVPTSQLLEKDAMFGLHPELKPLQQMWRNGSFGAVHAVGLPVPNRSHFDAMEVIEDADPTSEERRGWINRMVGLVGNNNDAQQAMQIGSAMVPASLYGPTPTLTVKDLSRVVLPGPTDKEAVRLHRQAYARTWSSASGPLALGASTALATTTTLNELAAMPDQPRNGARYPYGDLGESLREAAQTIRAGVGARVITIDFGGWDMHTFLGSVDAGNMKDRALELAQSLAAFFTDLGALSDRVTVATISEFGRRVAENGNSGLDHGWGNAMMLLGAGVRGGTVYGRWPGLDDLESGDLRVTTDYRQVLAEVVAARFPDVDVSSVFPVGRGTGLGLMRS